MSKLKRQYLPALNHQAVFNKFNKLIDDIVAQFKLDGLVDAIQIVAKCVPDEANLGFIDTVIKSKCELLPVNGTLSETKFAKTAHANDTPKIFAQLTLNEQFYILAHMDLTLIINEVDTPNPAFADLVCVIVRNTLLES